MVVCNFPLNRKITNKVTSLSLHSLHGKHQISDLQLLGLTSANNKHHMLNLTSRSHGCSTNSNFPSPGKLERYLQVKLLS